MNREALAKIAFGSVLVGSMTFLLLPVVVLIVFSFNSDRFPSLPWKGFTLAWYGELSENLELREAFTRSCVVAASSALVSTVLGFMAAYGFRHWSSAWANAALGFIFLPNFVPYFLLGLATAIYFGSLGIGGNLWAIALVHVVICAPVAFGVIRTRLDEIGHDVEEAAVNLGAGRVRVVLEVMVPNTAMAMVGGFLLAFAFSWDEFLIAWFLSGFDTTLPVAIWAMVRAAISPEINALGALVFVTSVLLVSGGYFLAVSASRRGRGASRNWEGRARKDAGR